MKRIRINSVLALLGALLFCASLALAENKQHLPTVVIITTGGTIAEKTDPNTGGAVPALSGKDLIAAIPSLSKVAHIKVINFPNIDSSHMTPQIWANLSIAVDKALEDPEVKGAVVTHGTDTMAEDLISLI